MTARNLQFSGGTNEHPAQAVTFTTTYSRSRQSSGNAVSSAPPGARVSDIRTTTNAAQRISDPQAVQTGTLTISVLGPASAIYQGEPLRTKAARSPSPKALALLCYLAVDGRTAPRQELAQLFWPGGDEANLRVALSQLRTCQGAQNWLLDGDAVGVTVTTDLQMFQANLRQRDFGAAIELWGQHDAPEKRFLENAEQLGLPPDFLDGWVTPRRQEALRDYLSALYQEALLQEQLGETDRALELALLLLRHDPLHEYGVQLAMRVYERLAEPGAGAALYEGFCETLRAEGLGDPLPESKQLARRLSRSVETQRAQRSRGLEAVQAQLATATSAFVGRERELRELPQLFRDPAYRLVTLLGPGGSGKSRLALELARREADAFPHGVVHVPLEGVDDTGLIPDLLCAAAGVPVPGDADPTETFLDFLSHGRHLVVLDNFEQLLGGANLAAQLASAMNGVVLVTSRVSLGLRSEHLYEVSGLAYPEDPAAPDFHDAPAVRLFVQAARRTSPSYELADGDRQALIGLCRFVAGLPLYIEHLASWVRLMPPHVMLQELAGGLELFSTGFDDLPERHRRLSQVLEGSWGLLARPTSEVLAGLTVFRGGFTIDSAREVAGADLSSLRELLDHSFITPAPTKRFTIQEANRVFAHNKLLGHKALLDEVLGKRADYFMRFASDANAGMRSAAQAEWLSRQDDELGNIRALLAWARDNDPRLGLAVTTKLAAYWDNRALWREALDNIDYFLEHAPERRSIYADALRSASYLNQRVGNMSEAEARLTAAIDLYEELNDKEGLASALVRAGAFHAQRGQLALTVQSFERSLALYEELGQEFGISLCLLNLGVAHSSLYDYERSREYMERALVLKRGLGDAFGLMLTTSALAYIAVYESRLDEAGPLIHEALTQCDELGLVAEKAHALITLGWLKRERGELSDAREVFNEALRLADEVEDLTGRSHALAHLGNLAHIQGDDASALAYVREALPIQYELEATVPILGSLVTLSLIARRAGGAQRVALLHGAMGALEARTDARLTKRDRVKVDELLTWASAELGATATELAEQQGRGLSQAQVLELALEQG